MTAHVFSALLRTDFRSFVWKCFNTISRDATYVDNWHIESLAYHLQQVQQGKIQRLLVNMPPRALKSICVSVAYTAWLLGHNPECRIVVVSYSNELALELHRQFKMVIDSDWYQRTFPAMRLAKDTGLEAVTTQGGCRYATSIEGSLTGRGANLIIIDDPHKADEALSAKARAKIINWYQGTLASRLDDKQSGQIILVMQRLHPDDLSGHLLRTGDWCHLNLPAIAPDDCTIPLGPGRVKHWRRGEPLQPKREDARVLEAIKREIGSQRFAAQYLQQPVPDGGNALKREWFPTYDQCPVQQPGDRIVHSWDVAAAIGDSNDYSVCTTWLKRRSRYYLLDVFRARLAYPDLRRKIPQLAREFGADTILIEKAGFGLSLLQDLRTAPPHGMPPPIGIVPKGDKQDRLAAQSAKIEAGQVVLPGEAPWLADFLNEALAFPNGRHDDQVDSLSQFLYWASDPWSEPGIEAGLPIFGGPYD
ncbi:phage terminase large subunit [Bradyrhizobium sp. CNPSo 4010]|uniref:Phage terminase large subunit n=1 Tax=Bradyrhizobium agreste TaxID=2751811 RepID=A0ABS0PVF5_9BRAD|nr:phage terminase large subunit [Bradyrhizobium agreste]MBH5401182.1 phage terminase large subunit [Bradyrhizobium agreste]